MKRDHDEFSSDQSSDHVKSKHKDASHDSPLYRKCFEGDIDGVKKLLLSGHHVNETNLCGETPIFAVCVNGNIRIARMLLLYGANVDVENNMGYTPLTVACKTDMTDIVDMLIREGATVNISGITRFTPLLMATFGGHEDIVRLLLQKDADVNGINKIGETPLHIAVLRGYRNIIGLLIRSGAKKDVVDEFGRTPLSVAICTKNMSVITDLLRYGVDVEKSHDDSTPLIDACNSGDEDMVRLLVHNGANVTAKNSNGYTPLNISCMRGNSQIVDFLLGTDAIQTKNTPNERGETPLDSAVFSGNEHIVQRLLHIGVDINSIDSHGDTPLCVANKIRCDAIVSILLKNGADPMTCRNRLVSQEIIERSLSFIVTCKKVQIDHFLTEMIIKQAFDLSQ